jgi:hypothetical protein
MKANFFFLLTHFLVRKWDFDRQRDMIDTVTTDNGNVFVTRHNKLQWFRPSLDRPLAPIERDFPRTIQRLSVKKTALLVGMSPETPTHHSETFVFAKNKCFRSRWKDNTMLETVVEENGYLLRSNYFGDISYGNHDSILTYNTKTFSNLTYSAMTVHDKYLWCATQYQINNTWVTRVDAFHLFVRLNDMDHIGSVPEMSFFIQDKGDALCRQPLHLSVCIKNHFPQSIAYIVIGYMIGGLHVAQADFPLEKDSKETMTSYIPNEKSVLSVAFDMPYLFFLDEEGISTYRIYPRADVHRFLGKYHLGQQFFNRVTQIVAIQKQVFWNGEPVLRSAEICED